MAMKSSGIGALAATVCLSLGAVSAHADTFGTVSFDDLTLDTQYSVGNATTSLTVLYGDFGGNLNIIVNDLLVNVSDWSAIHNTTIAGVDATVETFDSTHGRITLVGNITTFGIGGQEFWIDDINFKPVPAPGALMLLAPAVALGARRRRR